MEGRHDIRPGLGGLQPHGVQELAFAANRTVSDGRATVNAIYCAGRPDAVSSWTQSIFYALKRNIVLATGNFFYFFVNCTGGNTGANDGGALSGWGGGVKNCADTAGEAGLGPRGVRRRH